MSYERHPLSAAWPDMARDEFDALVLSIQEHGQREPIMLYDGQVLDGWHRLQACESAGRKPQFAMFEGSLEDAEAFVCDKHTRRSLSATQRATAVLAMYSWRTGAGRPKNNSVSDTELNPFAEKKTVAQLAQKAGVSVGTVDKAKTAMAKAPERVEDMRSGKVSATTVVRQSTPEKAAPQRAAEKPEAPAVAQAPVDDAQEEIMRDYERLLADNQRLTAIVESTDAGKAALAEVKRLTEVVRVLEERNRGLMNEKNQALEQAKMWMRKAQRAEKAAKEAAEGVAF